MNGFVNHPFWDLLALISCGIGFVAAILFVVKFQHDAGWTWWRHRNGKANLFGRFLMIRKILLSTLFGIVIANRLVGEWPGRSMITGILMLAFALHTFVPYRLLNEAQRAHTKEAREDDGVRGH